MTKWVVLVLFLGWATGAWASPLAPLRDQLIAKGFDPHYIDTLLNRPEAQFLPQVMPRKLLHDEYKLPYDRFLAPERIAKAQNFLGHYKDFLLTLEKRYGVPKEVLVAMFLVETDLGHCTGRYRTFNVLASMALSADWGRVRTYLPENLTPEEEKRLKAFMARRARWAFNELCAFLRLAQREKFDPLSIKGSIFGAFGLPQFVPSSVLSYGIDWDQDGQVNLFELEDALASMANYLARHGWRDGLSCEEKIKVIKTYNNSQPYAETILKVAERLGYASGCRRD